MIFAVESGNYSTAVSTKHVNWMAVFDLLDCCNYIFDSHCILFKNVTKILFSRFSTRQVVCDIRWALLFLWSVLFESLVRVE